MKDLQILGNFKDNRQLETPVPILIGLISHRIVPTTRDVVDGSDETVHSEG